MKYLFVSSDKFPPFRVDISELFGKEMVRRGHVIDFVLQSEDVCPKPHIRCWSGCRVFVGARNSGDASIAKVKKHFLNILNDLKMITLVKKTKYDFFLIKDKFFAGSLATLLAKIYRVPLFYWLSFPFPEANLHRAKLPNSRFPLFYKIRGLFFKYLLYNIIMPTSTHVFVQSEQMKKDINAKGIEKGKMTVVPMGISENLLHFAPLNQKNNFEDHPKIVYLGTMTATRRIDFVIRVFKQVHENWPKAKLYMVGSSDDAQDVEMLKKLAQDLGIFSSIIFTGFLPRKEAMVYVQNADVCLSPFYPTPILNSTSPTKIIEYMALQKPVVANEHPEQERILLDSKAGICVPYNEAAFADAICYLLANTDEALEMGLRGRQYVQQYRTYTIIAAKLDQKMESIIGLHSEGQ